MCGIAGFIAGHGAANAAALAPMLARIAHRGPDGQGTFVEGPAALGHCRLAIIDLEGGAQPLYSEDKNLVVVFNGEIYNYRALTAELTALGHTFATRTDTEVLLHGWEQWGRELLPRLRGMFAFALWDRRAGVLFCARDMFGIKPLYYCRCADGTLLFASEIKAFLDHPSFAKRLNTAQLPLYLSCQYSPGRDTFFAGVQKLLPGHFLEFSDGIVRTTRWVQPAFLPGDAPVSPAEIEEVLRGSAAAHKVADVEVAGFLSGGVDSAYLTALARPARTYTISYAEPKYDESFPARALARSLGVRNRVRRISPGEFWDAVPAVQYHMDEPLADAAAVALYFLNREAAKDVKVVLSGEGADELFGGYPLYRQAVWAERWQKMPRAVRRALAALLPGCGLLRRGALPRWQRSARANYVFETTQERDKYLKRDYCAPTPAQRCKPYFDAVRGLDEPTAVQVGRLADLAAAGHPAQGGPHEHGPQPGAAGAVPGPAGAGRGADPAPAVPLHRAARKIALRAAAARRLPPNWPTRRSAASPCRWRTGCGRRNITRWSRPSSPARQPSAFCTRVRSAPCWTPTVREKPTL